MTSPLARLNDGTLALTPEAAVLLGNPKADELWAMAFVVGLKKITIADGEQVWPLADVADNYRRLAADSKGDYLEFYNNAYLLLPLFN